MKSSTHKNHDKNNNKKMFKTIYSKLKRHPSVFNGCSSFLLFIGSDMIAQYLEYHNKQNIQNDRESFRPSNRDKNHIITIPSSSSYKEFIDYKRLLSAGAIGIFFGVCVYPAAYAYLDNVLPGTKFATVFKKSILEICTVGIFVNSTSMLSRGILVGKEKNEVLNHVYEEMPDVTLNYARVWLPYNMVAFSLIPVYVRPTTTALMESAWQTYISLRSNNYNNVRVQS